MECKSAILMLINHGVQRRLAAERNPHAVDLTFIQMSCWISLQITEMYHLLTASAKYCRLKLGLPQISLQSSPPSFNHTRTGWLSTLHVASCFICSYSLIMLECKTRKKSELLWSVPNFTACLSINQVRNIFCAWLMRQPSRCFMCTLSKRRTPWRRKNTFTEIWTVVALAPVIHRSEDVRFWTEIFRPSCCHGILTSCSVR